VKRIKAFHSSHPSGAVKYPIFFSVLSEPVVNDEQAAEHALGVLRHLQNEK